MEVNILEQPSMPAGVSPLARTELVGENIIRERAYVRYLRGGLQDGHALDDWLQAEQEVIGVVYGTAL
jgi:hypothetical protein